MGAGEAERGEEAKLLFSYVGQVPRRFCLPPLNCRQDKISPRLGIKQAGENLPDQQQSSPDAEKVRRSRRCHSVL